MRKIRIKQIRSTIGQNNKQIKTIKGLGLGKIGREVDRVDTASIRGMITKVQHLLCIKIIEA